jgi:hypothetical protein
VPALNVVLTAGADTPFPIPMLFPFRKMPNSGELVADVLLCKYKNALTVLGAV